ncbi:MAG TPA: CopD family protein [Solirubrobacteraceae bacterium]|nr:CopD family protein [Solirubrobacteraceae bacterium]
MPRRLVVLLIAALAAGGLLTSASTAHAHAELTGTSPVSGATVAKQPPLVVFDFNEHVGGTTGAVRVYDEQGNEVDDGSVTHPGGDETRIGVGLRAHLPEGSYTATYRVISADTHVVDGGLVFSIGRAGTGAGPSVASLISRNETGAATKIAFGVVRALDYLTVALLAGGLAFMWLAWRRAEPPRITSLATAPATTTPDPGRLARLQEARAAFASGLRRMLILAAIAGLIVGVLGIVLQGATAAGVSFWRSLHAAIIEDTLSSRFGEVWGGRVIDWLLIGSLIALPGGLPETAGGGGRAAFVRRLMLLSGGAYLVLAPALGGHAAVESPVAVFFTSDVVHVLGASIWVGGIACLLLVLPRATARMERGERTELLLGTLERFSPLALACVIAIAATGVLQAYIDVRSLHSLLHTTYGLLILAKTALLIVLIGAGWINRERVIPTLATLVRTAGAPGATGVRARHTLRAELVLMLSVLGVTAALIAYTPPIDAAAGPFSASSRLGGAELQVTLEPAHVGLNTMHVYLFDARTGAQFTKTRELSAEAELPAKGIGPLPLKATPSGPGHFTLSSVALTPAGTWRITITDRVSEFEELSHSFSIPIR